MTFSENMNVAPSQTMQGLPRAIYPLVLLYSMNSKKIIGRTRLEKLIFVIQKRLIEDKKLGITASNYDFRPYNFGPFTEEVLDDVESLSLMSLVSIDREGDNQEYDLTTKGVSAVESLIAKHRLTPEFVSEIRKIAKFLGDLPLQELVERVYKEYPDYAKNSLIKSRFLQ